MANSSQSNMVPIKLLTVGVVVITNFGEYGTISEINEYGDEITVCKGRSGSIDTDILGIFCECGCYGYDGHPGIGISLAYASVLQPKSDHATTTNSMEEMNSLVEKIMSTTNVD
jgi:hypothetical protein